MKSLYAKQILKTVALTLFATSPLYAQQKPSRTHIGLVYPLSSNGSHAPLDSNTFSLNIIAGVSAAEDGFTLAGLTNIIHHSAKGVQIAGFSNHIGGNAEGTRVAGFMNNSEDTQGASVAGFLNISKQMKGAQVAGFMNLAKNTKGFQLAGFLNKSEDASTQVAGFANLAKNTKDFQLAGFLNSSKDASTQVAGFMNVAKKVKGVQIASFINIADSSDYPIGLINLVKNGEKSIGITVDENLTTLLSFRSGGRILYGIIGIGYNFKNDKEIYAMEAGLGAHLFTRNAFRVNIELAAVSLESFKIGRSLKSSFRILPAYKISKHIEVFGGPSLKFTTMKWSKEEENMSKGLKVGCTGGIQFIL